MNLRVDLILDSEKRSASVINVRSIVRIASIVIPSILLLVVTIFVVNTVSLSHRIEEHQSVKTSLQGPQKEAVSLRAELAAHQKIVAELGALKTSSLPMKDCMKAIEECTPPQIQFHRLVFLESVGPFEAGKVQTPARIPVINIDGMVVVADAMTYIQQLKDAMQKHPALSNLVSSIDVTDFRAPDQGSSSAGATTEPYLLFAIKATLKPRKLQ